MIKIIFSFLILVGVLYADRDGGPYLGIGYGTSTFKDHGLFSEIKKDSSQAFTFYAGAYINKHLSVEIDYVRFDPWSLDDGYIAKNDLNESQLIRLDARTISTMAHYAFFDDVLDFYGKFGVGEMKIVGLNKKGFSMLFGIGAAIRFNEQLSVKLAYDTNVFEYEDIIDTNNAITYKMKIDYIYTALEVQF